MNEDKLDSWLCGECEKPMVAGEVTVMYDGERCHIDCAANAQDEIGFDDFFGCNG